MHKLIFVCILFSFANSLFGQGKFKNGDNAPELEGKTWTGTDITQNQPIGKTPTLLVFYQGSWNTYDIKFINALGAQNEVIQKKGYRIILVTAEKSIHGQKMLMESNLTADVLLDEDLQNTSNYGFGVKMSKKNLPDKFEKFAAFNLKHTGRKDNVVPVPACVIIGTDGIIKWFHSDWDYRHRPEVSEIIGHL